jgi:type I restriction enzyme S subunit
MELKPGYKETEIGIIPVDWDFGSFLQISRQIMDYRGRTPKKLGMEWGGGDIPALSAGNVKMGYIDFKAECYFASEALYKRWMTKGELEKDDILFTTEAPLGNVALVPDDQKYILSQRTILLQLDKEIAVGKYVFQAMLSDQFQRLLADYSSGSTAKGIQRKKFEQLGIALPSLPEQRSIATALSDVDALLNGLDRLIAKKRDLKQATMQQLLTGKTRLPGFEGEWEVKRLGELATFHKGKGLPKSALNPYSTEPCIHYGELFTQYGESIIETISRTHRMPDEFRSVANDVLMPTSDVTPRGLAKASCVLIDGVVLGGDILVIRTNPSEVSGTFLSYVIRREDDQVLRLVTGTTVFHLYGTDMKKFTFKLPPISEQQAIVTVLSDMDAEITALERHRNKTKDIKQAMMQELLTGKTRLIDPLGATR